jgi:hypothetical protein
MLVPLEELTAWTNNDIAAETRASLPPGWRFSYGLNRETGWWAKIANPEGDVQWEQSSVLDERLVLFAAYGWLHFRDRKPQHPAWARRREVVPKPRSGRLTLPGTEVPDVPDLDPAEIRSVYFPDNPAKRR